MIVDCLHCQAKFEIDQQQLGKETRCPVCKQLTVPLFPNALADIGKHSTPITQDLGDDQWSILQFLQNVTSADTSARLYNDREPFNCYLEMSVVPWGKDLKTGIFVDLSSQNVDEVVQQARALQEQSTSEKIGEIVQRCDRLIVVGEAGFGKTSALKYLAWKMAKQRLSSQPSLLPVYIYLGAYDQGGRLDRLINHALNVSDWRTIAQKQQLQFLLDGLDEIPQVYRQQALSDLMTLLRSEPQHRCLITTTEEGYEETLPLKSFHIVPLTENEIRTFIMMHFAWLSSDRHSTGLINVLDDHVELQPYSRVPVLLAMLVGIYHVTGEVPTDPFSIVRSFVGKSVLPELKPKLGICLARLAFEMIGDGRWITSLNQWRRIVDAVMAKDNDVTNTPLLVHHNESIQFMHRSIQELFAAKYLKEESVAVSELADEKPRMEGMVEFYRLIMGDFGEPSERQVLFARSFTKWHGTLVILSGLVQDASPIIQPAVGKRDLKLASDCFLAAQSVHPDVEHQYVQALRNKIIDFSTMWEEIIGSMAYSGLSWAEMNHQRHQMRLSLNQGLVQLTSILQDVAQKSREARICMAELFLDMEVVGKARCILCEALMRQLWELKDKEMLEMFREPLLQSEPCCDRVLADVAIVKNLLLFGEDETR